jgi:uncharacterized protein YjbI with pentapeptide repeats
MADAHPPSPDNEALERTEKVRLENQLLRRQLTRKFLLLEWAKAIAGPVAVFGLCWTMYIAISQRGDARRERDDERFDRAITRIGSTQVPERLTGIAGLGQFLNSSEPERQAQSLQYLVNAAVIEQDPTVRSAILEIFDGLAKSPAAQQALGIALTSARDKNRAILKRYVGRYFATPLVGRLPSGPGYTEVPIGKLSAEEQAPLETTASIMAALIRAGAKIPDLSQTYCVECQFGFDDKSVDLSYTNFDGAYLRRADFRNADLSGSSFHNADLVGTGFISANLRAAKLTEDLLITPWQELAAMAGNNLHLMYGANFACADLYEADFSGRSIFTFIYKNPVLGAVQHDNFAKANFRKTKLMGFQFLLAVPAELVEKSNAPLPFDIRKIFPVTTGQGGTGPSDTIRAGDGKDYVVWAVATNADFRFTGNVDTKAFWDVVLAFRQLYGARNLFEADMPVGMKNFIQANERLFSPTLGDPGCTVRGE